MKFFSHYSRPFMTFAAAALLLGSCKDDEDPTEIPDEEDPVTITAISPDNGPLGTEVEISGTNFGDDQADHVVAFNGTTATIVSLNDSRITVTVPEEATTGKVTLSLAGETIEGPVFTVTEPETGISSLNPASGAEGMTIKINGNGFGDEIDDHVVSFNGTEAEITSVSNAMITVVVPEGVTTGPVTLTMGGETFDGPEFTVLEGDEIALNEGFSMDAGIATLGQAFIYSGGGLEGNTALRLTPAKSDRTGAAYYGARIPVQAGFETTFDFRISRPGKPEDVEGEVGADGFAFIIQNEGINAMGSRGSDLGYGGITNAVVVEFDIYQNEEDGDPDGNHISIQASDGIGGPVHAEESYSLAMTSGGSHPGLPVDFIGNETEFHTARIVYVPGLLQVFVDDMEVPLEAEIMLEDYISLTEGKAYVGFTGSTNPAYGWASLDILNWTLAPVTETEEEAGEQ